jgi:formamidopyrimidine-DNA glycosylase
LLHFTPRYFSYDARGQTKPNTTKYLPLTSSQIGEVARVVHYLRKYTLNRTIASCTAHDDPIVYGKVGTSASAFQDAVVGRRVTGAAQQGKYFYMTFDKSPHAVMHLGMTGWVKFSSEETGYYRSKKESQEEAEWPPKYCKFLLKFEKETVKGEVMDEVEVAFIDARRLARIRLVECEAEEIRNNSPLKENGPDPVIDKEKFTVDFLQALLKKKRVPVKALMLDQANISGAPFSLNMLPTTY